MRKENPTHEILFWAGMPEISWEILDFFVISTDK